MAKLLQRLGFWSATHPWRVLLGWVAVLLVAGGGFLLGFKGLENSLDIPNLPSSDVLEELQSDLPDFAGASGAIVLQREDGQALSQEQRAAISELAASAATLPDVARVVDPFMTELERADQMAELDAGQAQLDTGQAQLDAGRTQLEAALAQAQAVGGPLVDGIQEQRAALDGEQARLDTAAAQLELGTRMLELAEPIRLISEDGSTAIVNVAFTEPRLGLAQASKDAVVAHFTETPIDGIEVGVSTEISQGIPSFLGLGELAGLFIAALVLGVMLRTLLGALIPLAIAVTGVGVSMLIALSFAGVITMASTTPVLGVMLGLAVGIDYSLFIINRHRKQLLAGTTLRESIGLANGTSGNAVVFAGATVVVALLALNVTGVPFLGVMGTVGALAILTAVLVSITLTPALLSFAGMRVLGRRERERLATAGPVTTASAAGLPATASNPTSVRPMPWWRAIVTVIATIAVLAIVALPALDMRVGLPGGESEPAGSLSQRAYAMTEDQFGVGANGPLLVAATYPEAFEGTELLEQQLAIAERIAESDSVQAVAPVATNAAGTVTAFQVLPIDGPNAASTATLVGELRALELSDGTTLGVTGQAAMNIDVSDRLLEALPLYLAVVVGFSLLIMMLVFRSLLVPVIATGGFILSLFATYGATVTVFQFGWGAALLGIESVGPILNFLPIVLIGILFGLAMDYQLFLATGMREAYVHGTPARLAVTRGFRAGRNVVIAAGLIMISIFGGFIFAESGMIRSIGFGLAAGILFDAFVVRMLLMPALMHIFGKAAWWIPKWLDRILPNVDVEGASLERRAPQEPSA